MPESYERVVASWRAQNPRWAASTITRTPLSILEVDQMERESVDSSTILSIGYDPGSETLEVEFKNGGVYQYYNVPNNIHELLMQSASKGQFLHVNIKNSFPYSRV